MGNPALRDRQIELSKLGFYPVTEIDGDPGPLTRRAEDAYHASMLPRVAGDLRAIGKRIVDAAWNFANLTETAQNARWDDLATPGPDAAASELRRLLLETGWQLGWAYCAALAEVCWRIGYSGRAELAEVCKLITPSVMDTFTNFKRLGMITRDPLPGALGFMQHGTSWQGHMFIVAQPPVSARVATLEGNTTPGPSSAAQDRAGDGCYSKMRTLNFERSSLTLLGFANPFVR